MSSDGVVVTEYMLFEAAEAGDLESLRDWAQQGVRVTTVGPLFVAAEKGRLEVVRCLVQQMGANVNRTTLNGATILMYIVMKQWGNSAVVQCLVELGADVNQAIQNGRTPLNFAADGGHLAVVRRLVEAGARLGAVSHGGSTSSHISLHQGRYATVHYLLEEGFSNMDGVNYKGKTYTVWSVLTNRLAKVANGRKMETDPLALAGLLRALVLRSAPPPALEALLSPELVRVVQEGARLRARLPAYLVRRRALLDVHCPVLLPPLRALVHGYMELTTTEELWATGLGVEP
jgi:hypothetical protein